MTTALARCVRAVPLTHLRDLAPARGVVALRCTRSGCTRCADFETDGRLAFERRLRSETHPVTVRFWNCDEAELRDLALSAGVHEIPAYVLVDSTGNVTIRNVS